MTDHAITILIAAAIAVVVMSALVMAIVQHGRRTAATVAKRDAEARAEQARRCNCVPRFPTHLLQVWLTGRDDPLTVICDVDEAHRAYQEVRLQIGLYAWRTEFVFDPTVSVLATDGSFVDIVVPHVQAVQLYLRVMAHD